MATSAADPTRAHEDWERDQRFQELVELAPDGIMIHDGDVVVLANAALMRLAGATRREQVVGVAIDTFLNPPYLKAVEARLLDSMLHADDVLPVRDTFRRVDGSEVQVEVRAIAFMDRDRPAAHLVVHDITGRLTAEATARKADHRLQQAQRLETIGALAGGVAHEVNNMMSVVLGSSEFLLQDSRLPVECQADVHEIMKAADRTAVITGQLLASSRRAVHRPHAVELRALVQSATPMLRRILGEDRQLNLTEGAPRHIWADSGQLEQILINLVMNARDAMPQGGTLTIDISECDVADAGIQSHGAAAVPGQYALLQVQDTGVGMDAGTQARIFEPFFTTKPVGQGTGLGLSAALGILTQNNGFTSVTSAPGHGAAFSIYLPLCSRPGVPPTVPVATLGTVKATRAGATIIVIDDEMSVRKIAARSLEHAGFHVIQAVGGTEVIAHIERYGPPSLVLADVMMPGIGGVELARRLQRRWPALPIVFMSGHSAEVLFRQGADAFATLVIQKPFTPGQLIKRVDEALTQAETRFSSR